MHSACLEVPVGTVAKKDLSDADIHIIKSLFQQLQPHQIYAAGDLSDPHGTHRTCLQVWCLDTLPYAARKTRQKRLSISQGLQALLAAQGSSCCIL